MTTMGDRIRYLRDLRGITQETLAREIQCDRSSLSKWENGLTYPPAEVILCLADYFKVSTDFLYCRQTKAVAEEKVLHGLTEEEKERLKEQADFYRYRKKKLPEDSKKDSSGLTGKDSRGGKTRYKKQRKAK